MACVLWHFSVRPLMMVRQDFVVWGKRIISDEGVFVCRREVTFWVDTTQSDALRSNGNGVNKFIRYTYIVHIGGQVKPVIWKIVSRLMSVSLDIFRRHDRTEFQAEANDPITSILILPWLLSSLKTKTNLALILFAAKWTHMGILCMSYYAIKEFCDIVKMCICVIVR